MYYKTIIEFPFLALYQTSCQRYLPQPSASAYNSDLGVDISRYHAQHYPIIAYFPRVMACQ